MSVLKKDALIKACADAYRTASGKGEQVKAGELAEKISELKGGKSKGILFSEVDEVGKPLTLELFGVSELSRYQFSGSLYRNVGTVKLTDSQITIMPDNCFSSCSGLRNIDELISQVKVFSNVCFSSCTGLEEVTFTAVPQAISSTAFFGCTGIKTLRVPWSQGDIGGAPWGAENATIIYDYKGGN